MKTLLFTLGTAALRNWLSSDSSRAPSSSGILPGMPKLNVAYLSQIAKKLARLGATAFLFSLFFVAGFTMSLFSVAQNFDSLGYFAATNVFYAGLGLTLVSLTIVFLNLRALAKLRIDQKSVYLYEAPTIREETREPGFDLTKIAGPVMAGLVSGWASRRARTPQPAPAASAAPAAAPEYRGPRAI